MLPVQNGPEDKTLTVHALFSNNVIFTPSLRQTGEKNAWMLRLQG